MAGNKRWPEYETNYLKRYYRSLATADIAKRLGRTEESIRRMARRLKLSDKPAAPCPNCGRPRQRDAQGKPTCKWCRAADARRRYRGETLAVAEELPPTWEWATCECGERFGRSTQRQAVAVCCHRCRSESVKDPTIDQIRAEVAAIQATWDEKERHRRAGLRYDAVEVSNLDGAWFMPGGDLDYGYRDVFDY